jgi:two-component system NtrC family sensor kinase
MIKNLRFPIRIKLLVVLLLLITFVVSIITFTMAKLFHTDKTTYIHDLVSVIALHTAEEAGSLLVSYQGGLKVFSQVLLEKDLSSDRKRRLIEQFYNDFKDFVAVTLYVNGVQQATMYDSGSLTSMGMTEDDIRTHLRENPLPLDLISSGQVFIRNSTLSEKHPCFTMAVSSAQSPAKSVVVAAMVRLDALQRLAGRSRVFDTFLVDSKGNLIAHRDPRKIAQHDRLAWISQNSSLVDKHALGSTIEYTQDSTLMVVGFARVPLGGLLTVVQIPKSAAYLTARELLNNLIFVALALLMLSAVISMFWSKLITRPVEDLSEATKIVGQGRFDVRIVPSSRDEIGDLAVAFNMMASELEDRETALKNSQAALIQSEKMAAFGQLGAGIAHEVKNPLAGILGYAQLTIRKLEPGTPIHQNLEIIEKETKRCKSIMDNLLKFARQEKAVYAATDVNRTVADACTIVNHQLEINNVKLEKDFAPDLPEIRGNANQLQQVFMNLMINAQQALNGNPGTVTVSTRFLHDRIEIRVKDTGPGIPEDIQKKIFEPFFTTKKAGKGTGLGLSVSYGIIREHKGDIRVESAIGKGAEFTVSIPLADDDSMKV